MFENFAKPWRRRRFELLDHLECLKSRSLRASQFTLAGVAHGSPAAQLDPQRVIAVRHAPIVAREQWTDSGEPRYYAHDGRRLPLEEVVKSTVESDGLLVLKEHVGLVLRAGEVRAFEIYRPMLRHFCYIRSFVELLDQFGLPDTVVTRQRNGKPGEHRLIYRRAHKQLTWDCSEQGLSVVALGNPDEHPRPRPPRGRREKSTKTRPPLSIRVPSLPTPSGGWAPQAS